MDSISKQTPTHVDLFSGVGGFATGMHAAGFSTLAAVEKVESCTITYKKNHPNVPVIHDDIRNVTLDKFHDLGVTKTDLVTSGMPCETFSTAGSKSRSFYDHRQTLFSEAIRIACLLSSPFLLLENVPALLTKKLVKGGSTFVIDEIYRELELNGYYNHKTIVLNSAHFGVPQLRERIFILASNSNIHLKTPTPLESRFTVLEAIEDLPDVLPNSQDADAIYKDNENDYIKLMRSNLFWNSQASCCDRPSYHKSPKHRISTIERFKLINQGEGLRDLFNKFTDTEIKELQERKVLPKSWYIQRNRRLLPNTQSPTVTSHCIDELIHPFLDRALTVREVARLQSFPDWYDIAGGPTICPHMYETQDKYEQLGDAVPPLLSYHWGITIKGLLSHDH